MVDYCTNGHTQAAILKTSDAKVMFTRLTKDLKETKVINASLLAGKLFHGLIIRSAKKCL